MHTIFAPATAQGRAGVAIIRISGPEALQAASVLVGDLPASHRVGLRVLHDCNGEILDQALVLPFHAPSSYTGEDVVELHLHGSIAIQKAVLNALSQQPKLRLAEPGEFTRRALENGRLDLTQVEGLADLIDSETEAQRQQAQRTLSGAVGAKVESWRNALVRAGALIEATIDFADEEVPEDVTPEVVDLLSKVINELGHEVAGSFFAERVREGFEVAILGAPNTGKSTLLNALAGRDAAITSEFAGTTRDIIEVRMDLKGLPVTLLDTAGLRNEAEQIEAIGIERAIQRAKSADLRVFLTGSVHDLPITPMPDDIVLKPKADLLDDPKGAVSGVTGQGISDLIDMVHHRLADRAQRAGIATHKRHRDAMQRALSHLNEAQTRVAAGGSQYDLAAEELRRGVFDLEALTGRIDVESLLDEIFASFCLGK